MYSIKGNNSTAMIKSLGAELKSLVVNGKEIIWQTNPEIWTGSAPILFPFVGRLKGQKYIYNGKEYNITKHGFARQSEFKVDEHLENKITLSISSNESTLKVYPFDFIFRVIFSIDNDILSVQYEVENLDDKAMLFCIGSHPALDLPLKDLSLSDYYLEFEKEERVFRYKLHDGLVKKEDNLYLNNEKIINLNDHIFNEDSIIFTNIESRSICIKNHKTSRVIKLSSDAPDIGIWAKPGANYVCIEPWYGYDDPVDSDNILETKPGVQKLPSKKTFITRYTLEAVAL